MVKEVLFLKSCWIWLVLMSIALASCSPPPPPQAGINNSYIYGSDYMWNMNNAVNDHLVQLSEEALIKKGGKIVSVGQEYKWIFPTDLLFYPHSPRLQWNAYGLLNNIAFYLGIFNKTEIQIAGFTQSTGDFARDKALSMARARKVSDYLWGQEVGANIIYIQGYQTKDKGDRIEISFRSIMV